MKKIIPLICVSALTLSSLTPAYCDDDVKVILNGAELAFDVPPQIIEGRTLVPLRVIFEALGASVDWNGETRTVTADNGSTKISMTIGDSVMLVNSEPVTLDVPPQIIDDRTLVPARAVAESFGASVGWDGAARTVTITSETSSPVPTETPAPAPSKSPEKQELPVTYEETSDLTSETVTDFRLLSVSMTESGDYEVTFEVGTFLESTGTASTRFICLDADGKQVDMWERIYNSTAYTPTMHTDTVTISGKTAVIVCDSK